MITRRGLLAGVLSLLGWRPKVETRAVYKDTWSPPVPRVRPWANLRNEEKEGPYCDYVAWETWMGGELNRPGNVMQDAFYVFDSSSVLERIGLYSVMCEVADWDAGTAAGAE